MLAELEAVRAVLVDAGEWPTRDSAFDSAGAYVQSNYVLLFPGLPRFVSERYTGVARADGRRDVEVPFKAVSPSQSSVLAWLDRVSGLEGSLLVVEGRSCSPLDVGTEDGVVLDATVKPGLFLVDGWVRFTSRPA